MGGKPGPLVSLVTPTLNQGAFLEETLRSVLGQTWPHVEYVVMDGGSRDATASILERYRSRLAHYGRGPDGGFGEALRKGFARCRGDVLGYLNSDDRSEERRVGKECRCGWGAGG